MMNQTIAIFEEEAPEELVDMGSRNHSYLQFMIAFHLHNAGDFTIFNELSLDSRPVQKDALGIEIPKELKPDIAVYPRLAIDFKNDQVKMTEMPLMVVEILSPYQGVKILVDKFKAYFALGVQSCWLVYPYERAIAVYDSPSNSHLYAQGNVIDATLACEIPLNQIFN